MGKQTYDTSGRRLPCKNCEKPIRNRQPHARYCSVRCRLEAQMDRRREKARAARLKVLRERYRRAGCRPEGMLQWDETLEALSSIRPCAHCRNLFDIRRDHAAF